MPSWAAHLFLRAAIKRLAASGLPLGGMDAVAMLDIENGTGWRAAAKGRD